MLLHRLRSLPQRCRPPIGSPLVTAAAAAASVSRSSTSASRLSPPSPPAPLDFENAAVAFRLRSTPSLLRSLFVFRLCTVRPLVAHAPALLALGERVLGRAAVAALVKATFFAQFCAGEDEDTIRPTIAWLRSAGVGAILDFAAEADVALAPAATATAQALPRAAAAAADPDAAGDEHQRHMAHNLQHSLLGVQLAGRALTQLADESCGDGAAAGAAGSARSVSIGFAAVKLSSFARPELLQRVSDAISEHERAFAALTSAANFPHPEAAAGASVGATADDSPPGVVVSRAAFVRLLVSRSADIGGAPALSEAEALRVFEAIDLCGDGVIDELDFADAASLLALAPEAEARELEAAAGLGASHGSLARHLGINAESLDAAGRAEWSAVVAHTYELAAAAADGGVSVMVDAEQSYLQPAIEAATLAAQRRFNRPRGDTANWIEPALAHARVLAAGGASRPAATAEPLPALRRLAGADTCYPAIYTTVQAYLVDAPARLARLRRRAQRERFIYGVKLVRGAYMVQERRRARELGYADPVHASQDATHACYDSCAADLAHAALAGRAEFMAATHNERSVLRLLEVMRARGVESPAQARGVSFGQLLGMCDHVSLSLGAVGYPVFKYVPYGPVLEVVPYLIRRAQENSSLLAGGVAKEIRLLQSEITRRASRGFAQ